MREAREKLNIPWFPGHMKKTVEKIRTQLRLVDLCCEIRDARIPCSSANPLFNALLRDKPRLILLNKSDMAEEKATALWMEALRGPHQHAMAYRADREKRTDRLYAAAAPLVQDLFARRQARSIARKEIRMMVVGIPNVGKSTFINGLAGKRKADAENRPGVTTQTQWVHAGERLLLLDTPGLLWPALTKDASLHLAFTGAIRDEVLETQELGYALLQRLQRVAPSALAARYGIDPNQTSLQTMDAIARRAGMLRRDGSPDYDRVGQRILHDFRHLRFGRITLEFPMENLKGTKVE